MVGQSSPAHHSLVITEVMPHRPATFECFLKLLLLPRTLPQSGADGEEEVTVLDLEETGYQASFSKLGASEPPRRDPVADVADPGVFMARSLVECSQAHPGQVSPPQFGHQANR